MGDLQMTGLQGGLVIKRGSTIRYEDGSVMLNFYSKLLKRTFESVMFVGSIVVTAEP